MTLPLLSFLVIARSEAPLLSLEGAIQRHEFLDGHAPSGLA